MVPPPLPSFSFAPRRDLIAAAIIRERRSCGVCDDLMNIEKPVIPILPLPQIPTTTSKLKTTQSSAWGLDGVCLVPLETGIRLTICDFMNNNCYSDKD